MTTDAHGFDALRQAAGPRCDVESFEVSGVKVSYSDYIMTPGFHQTA